MSFLARTDMPSKTMIEMASEKSELGQSDVMSDIVFEAMSGVKWLLSFASAINYAILYFNHSVRGDFLLH